MDAAVFFEIRRIPVHCNILWPTVEAALRAPRGQMRLARCEACGLLFNAAFDPSLVTYDESYENSLHCSPRFEGYADTLAHELADRFHLRGQLVVEIGCGKGEFLRKLCAVADARGLGIDASYDPAVVPSSSDDRVRFVREPFSSLPQDLQPALVFCRHVIEHLPDPGSFVAELAAIAGRSPGCHVFIEVPNVLYTLRDLGIWDLIYEHCTYFSAPALGRLCERAGLRVERIYPAFGNQFLCAEAGLQHGEPPSNDRAALSELQLLTARFASEYRRKVDYWESRLRELESHRAKVVLWGAGSKGITFVSTVQGAERISCLVDLNPRKQGRFVPGTGQQVVAPDALSTLQPDVIVVMNPEYTDEIGERARGLGVGASLELA